MSRPNAKEAAADSLPSQVDVLVLGAGLTGLSAALELQRQNLSVLVVEKQSQVGGHARTDEVNGFRFDRTGHLLHLRSERWRARVQQWLGEALLRIDRRSVVFSHGSYRRYPFQANTLGLPPEVAYECLMGFLEAQRSNHSSPTQNTPPRNFEEYCLRHFGSGFSRHFMLPYNTKLWGIEPSALGISWCERFVPRPQLADVIAGAVGLPDPKLGYNASFYYPKQGIGELPRAMYRELQRRVAVPAGADPVRLGRSPERLIPHKKEAWFGAESVKYSMLISTIPLTRLAGLLDPPPIGPTRAAGKLRSTSLRYLDIALRLPERHQFHWAYVPEARFPFYRVGCYSAFSSEMAPPNKSSLYVELAARDPEPLDRTLAAVLPGLAEMGLLQSREDVEFASVHTLEPAYVIYDDARAGALEELEDYLVSHSILSTGRYGGWNYSSMEDALEFGVSAAARAVRELRGQAP
ncbi:MAG TPA: FAD-dependent oxidoreductase [Polyangiaceae bacterium]|nr:FAD-dependent oxidoreductase [Polyangiaceae bacterium]